MMDEYDLLIGNFPTFLQERVTCLKDLAKEYHQVNAKVNLVSRKDINHIISRHILHSLSIAKVIAFKPNTKVLDVGTGGGLPGLPLAIAFPEAKFVLVDSIRKKIEAVRHIIDKLELENVEVRNTRVENLNDTFDFITARAVAKTQTLVNWTNHLISSSGNNELDNGWLLLKGGDLKDELHGLDVRTTWNLQDFFDDEFYAKKKLIHITPKGSTHSP